MSTADHFRSDPGAAAWTIRSVPETGSTNTDLLAEAGTAPDRTVLRTGHQTAGKGRLDRKWDAPPGANLLVSLLFREASDPGELVRRVGLAVARAARAETGVDARLKWPNDVVVDGQKLAGVLAQRAENGAVVVGTGVNLGWAPEGAARLGDIDPGTFLLSVLTAFDALPADIGDTYRAELATLGQRVRVIRPADELVGTAIEVDDDGRLIVVDECAISHHVDVGDIVHLRPD
ncbi:MAG: biotin--[acetyl-CoA-carboxylase] ligase [Ilumatobacter fluminis]|uniref:biotin--[acetyl-CoA-carboxylase] ligase n=1 Tax=Ilumatobacter fluminis TaxID=467091 RepID=UPI0032EE6C2F